jgi:hypothetical protein
LATGNPDGGDALCYAGLWLRFRVSKRLEWGGLQTDGFQEQKRDSGPSFIILADDRLAKWKLSPRSTDGF